MNFALAAHVIEELGRLGTAEVVVCAGARNSPFVALLDQSSPFRTWHFFEERSAGFFAVGRIKSLGRPVAVITTSGTAVGELLPAVMESYYSGQALIVVSADRPRRFRGTGAPQSAEQPGIFGCYATHSIDLEEREQFDAGSWAGQSPLHVNVCFEEPLLASQPHASSLRDLGEPQRLVPAATEADRAYFHDFFSSARRPIAIVGALNEDERSGVADFLLQLNIPVLCEGLSGLREYPRLADLRLISGDKLLSKNLGSFDAVIRLGGVPTARFWRDLEARQGKLSLLSIGALPFSGSSWGKLIRTSTSHLSTLCHGSGSREIHDYDDLLVEDKRQGARIVELLRALPRSEPGLVHALSEAIPGGSRVFLGNSLPIREWDLSATFENRRYRLAGNRGLNGIDGQTSTFLGFSEPGQENWALLGDLTALYDLAAPWVLKQRHGLVTRIAIINNGGGRIFSRMFESPSFQNEHELEFSSWAKLWGLGYERWTEIPQRTPDVANLVFEIVPDRDSTSKFWERYESLWA